MLSNSCHAGRNPSCPLALRTRPPMSREPASQSRASACNRLASPYDYSFLTDIGTTWGNAIYAEIRVTLLYEQSRPYRSVKDFLKRLSRWEFLQPRCKPMQPSERFRGSIPYRRSLQPCLSRKEVLACFSDLYCSALDWNPALRHKRLKICSLRKLVQGLHSCSRAVPRFFSPMAN